MEGVIPRTDDDLRTVFNIALNKRKENNPNASFGPNHLCGECSGALDCLRYSSAPSVIRPHKKTFEEFVLSAAQGCHVCSLLYGQVSINTDSEHSICKWADSRTPRENHTHPQVRLEFGERPHGGNPELGNSYTQSFVSRGSTSRNRNWKSHKGDSEYHGRHSAMSTHLVHRQPPILRSISLCVPIFTIPPIRAVSWIQNIPDAWIENIGLRIQPDVRGHARLSLWTGSEATMALARLWLETCQKDHSKCFAVASRPVALPTRLLDIGNGTSGHVVRLCFVSDEICTALSSRPEYFTLSHRWPAKPILRLLHQNIAQFQVAIELKSMPLAFQQSIELTRRLGYRYLWIDSLCIIQDDAEDWRRESAIMGEIYKGGVCNIAVSNNESTAEENGCFTVRNPLTWLDYERGNICLRSGALTSYQGPSGTLKNRGWVMQERALSPRTVEFGAEQIRWECHTVTENEGGVFEPEADRFRTQPWLHPKRHFLNLLSEEPMDISQQHTKLYSFYSSWTELVTAYAKCALTYESDRLIAIHGIVRQIEATSNMHSVAGLWEQLLPFELLWYIGLTESVFRSPTPSPRPSTYRAPTWSWASVDSPVTNDCMSFLNPSLNKTATPRIQILRVDVDALVNGQTTSGIITATAPCLKIDRSMLDGFRNKGDRFPLGRTFINSTPAGLQFSSEIEYPGRIWNPDISDIREGNLWAVLIMQFSALDHIWKDKRPMGWYNLGIIVRELGADEGIFERVGYFEEHFGASDIWPMFPFEGEPDEKTFQII